MHSIRLLLVLALVLMLVAPVQAQEIDEDFLRESIENDDVINDSLDEAGDIAEEREALSAEIGSLQATDVEIQAKIDELERKIIEEQERYDAAYAAQLDSIRSAVTLKHELEAAEAEVEAQHERLAATAVEAYMRPNRIAVPSVFAGDEVTEGATRNVYLSALAEAEQEALVAYEDAKQSVARVQGQAEAVAERADLQREVASEAKDALDDAREEQEVLKAELEARIAAFEAEVAALEAAEAELQAVIQARQASLIAEAEERARQQAAGQVVPSSAPGVLGWPTSGWVSSEFGPRWGRMHQGIDFAADTGTPIWAAADGQVFYAGWISGYGNTVLIDHGGGLATLYAHMSAIWVSDGQWVGRGEGIGAVGSTGNSTGPHLHFEVREYGVHVNPRLYLG